MADRDECLLDRKDVAERFGIPRRYLEVAGARGEGPRVVRIGRLVRYRPSDVREWIEANLSEGGAS